MSVEAIKESYRDALGRYESVRLVRRTGTGSSAPEHAIDVRGRATDYRPDELAGGVQQGDRKIIVYADDVTFSPHLRRGDKAIVRGATLNIEDVDDSTVRVNGVLIAYILRARG